jgi:hypothetical protein
MKPRCEMVLGGGRQCRTVLQEVPTLLGQIHWVCPKCVRRTQHLCRLCPAPLPSPRHWYCAPCAKTLQKQRHAARDQQEDRVQARALAHQRRKRNKAWYAARLADNRVRMKQRVPCKVTDPEAYRAWQDARNAYKRRWYRKRVLSGNPPKRCDTPKSSG